MAMSVDFFLHLRFSSCLLDLLLLLFHQKCLHRVVLVMVSYQDGELSLFWKHWPLRCFPLLTLLIIRLQFSLLAHHSLPADVELGRILIVPRLVSRMVDTDDPSSNVGSAEIVDGEVCTALVFVLEPPEAF